VEEAIDVVMQVMEMKEMKGLDSEWTSVLSGSLEKLSSKSPHLQHVLEGHGWNGTQFSGPPNLKDLWAQLGGFHPQAPFSIGLVGGGVGEWEVVNERL
jgi:hypothetical protein